jgi:hypothetical protein
VFCLNKNTILHKLLAQVWQGLGNNVRARIKDNGRFGWYMPPLQSMPKTSDLVICDGPPQQTTLAGRYGLLPAMNDRLTHGSVILMDDAIPQAATIQHWKEDFGAAIELVDDGEHTFAIIRPQ